MSAALTIVNIPLEGHHHRGIDDARNIAKIANLLLPDSEPQFRNDAHRWCRSTCAGPIAHPLG